MTGSEKEIRQSYRAPEKTPSFLGFLVRALAFSGLIVTFVSCFAQWNWVADLFAQFKVQWAIALFFALVLLALGRQWRWVVACAIGLVINAIPIWPYFVDFDLQESNTNQVEPDSDNESPASLETLRLLSLNVLTSNRRYDDVLALIQSEKPDFVVLLEVDSDWKMMLEPLLSEYSFSKFETREDNFGIGFLSNRAWSSIEIVDSRAFQLPSIDVRFDSLNVGISGNENEVGSSKALRIIATHPIPPITSFNWAARNEQLLNIARRFDASTSNIMVGDFNLSPWSPHFPSVLKRGGLRDSALGHGVSPTWYVFPTWVCGIKIDHALIGPGIFTHSHRVGPDVGSDHRAVVIDFSIE